ncbi:hypothetical protein IEQ34_002907 [Dendrobium chrysotoxum]|uniref:K+ potassium transporter integral membrane domain-containing protein n=1 Tax=Dendrobium chrysotoxum TaxID=161865 RepID=A0AAV7HIB4_DENCH|nr:hypothetical protein IEQ34_002907 [Dendrobium chrysotoxum]
MFIASVMASIIASQAMISATFAIIKQSMALGCFPRVRIIHTSHKHEGQVYIPEINFLLMLACVLVTASFKEPTNIGNEYGFDAIGEHTGSSHNHNLMVPFGGNHLVQRAPSHNRLSCSAIWRRNYRRLDFVGNLGFWEFCGVLDFMKFGIFGRRLLSACMSVADPVAWHRTISATVAGRRVQSRIRVLKIIPTTLRKAYIGPTRLAVGVAPGSLPTTLKKACIGGLPARHECRG